MSLNFNPLENVSNKVMPEDKTRKKLIAFATRLGCGKELKIIFDKYDGLLRNCTSESERKDIAKLGSLEVYWLLGGGGEFHVDGELVAVDKYDQDDYKHKSLIIL